MEKLTIREIHERTGIAIPTISRWCRIGKFPNAKKTISPAGEFWEIPKDEWIDFSSRLDEVKPGRPRKED